MTSGRYYPYPEYKDSKTDWLGEIPLAWTAIPVGRLFRRVNRRGHVEKELLSVYRDYGVIPKSSRDDNNNKPSEDLTPYQLVQRNDLVLNKMKAWQGSIAVSEHEGIVSPAYFVYQPVRRLFEVAQPRYVHYLLRNPVYIAQYLRRSKGIRVSQWDLDPEEFQRIELILPTLPEQTQIAKFLDHETAKIDRLIEKQQALIALLKEKRQAVISHAVTKGLNPHAPLKDSGIEWLGQVPAHWDVFAYRNVVTRVVVGIAEATTHAYAEEGVPIVRSTNIKAGRINQSSMLYIKPEFAKRLESKALLAGDIVTTRTGANVGDSAVVPESLHMAQCFTLVVSTPKPKSNPHFYNHFINSIPGRVYIELTAWGSSQPNISVEILQRMQTVAPPRKEQDEIVAHIEQASARFDTLTAKAQRAIDLMQERRTALISAAVTGKIDVRGWRPPTLSEMETVEPANH